MMTESDQHAVLGRLMFESKEAAERLAINHEKAKQMWRDMSAAVQSMGLGTKCNRSMREHQEELSFSS